MKMRGSILPWMKKAISLGLVAALCTLLPPSARAATPAQAYTFHTAVETGATDSERTLYFTPDYFSQSATQYDPHLATASLCMAMSAFGSNRVFLANNQYDYTKANYNWLELFGSGKLGFSDVRTNAYFTQQTRTDNIGYGLAWKNITIDVPGGTRTVPLVAVGVRGANYMSEWGGNVNVGTSGDHAGFSQAAKLVIQGVKAYIESIPALKGKDVKLWVSGFSRAAATSNLFAGYLDEAIADGSIQSVIGARLTKDDLYCYTFETPAGALKNETVAHGATYSNIFNLINPNDLVPKVAPYFRDAAFLRYGTDLSFPSAITSWQHETYEGNMKKIFLSLNSKYSYIIDDFRNYRIAFELKAWGVGDVSQPHSAAEFCSRFIADLAADGVRTRANFKAKYQDALTVLLDFFCGSGENFGGKANQKKLINYLGNNKLWMGWMLFVEMISNTKWPMENISDAAVAILTRACKDTGVTLSDAYKRNIGNMLATVIHEVITDKPMDNIKEVNYFLTFINASTNILQAHDPDVCLAWLMSMDDQYLSTTRVYQDCSEVLSSGEYRTVTLTGLTRARIQRLNNLGQPVGKAKDYEAGVITRQLRIMLPTDSAYSLYTYSPWYGSLTFNYMVTEYSPAVNGYKRVFQYKDAIASYTPNYEYVATIPGYTAAQIRSGIPAGSDLDYQLHFKGNANPIKDKFINKKLADIRPGTAPTPLELDLLSNPSSQTIAEGKDIRLAVSARGDSLNYQWLMLPAGSDTWRAIDGATHAEYLIPKASVKLAGNQYMCVVYDLYDDYQYSRAVQLYAPVPITGDAATPMLWALLLLCGLCGGLALYAVRRRRVARRA